MSAIFTALQEKGVETDVISTSAGFVKSSFNNVDPNLNPDVNKHIFDLSFPQFWFYSDAMRNWLHENVIYYDLIHLHIPFTAPFFMASRAAIKNKIPMVATLHGLLDPWGMAHKVLKKRLYYQFIEKKCLSSCAALHVTSSLEAQSVKNLNIPVSIVNIPWAVTSSAVQYTKTPDKHLIRLLFIGRLHPVKSIPTILNAVAYLKNAGINILLDLAGAGDPSYEKILREIIRHHQIHQEVIWHGHVDDDQKNILYQNADLFVLPSLHENFGLAAAEAMSAGLPVIVSDQVGLAPNVLSMGAGLVIPVSNDLSLVDAVRKIHQENLTLTMGIAAKNLVKNFYSFEVFSDKLVDMYRGAMAHYKK